MAEIANGSIFSQTDSSNVGALPGITGSSSPALIDNSIQALMGAIKREHDWRNFTVTSSGSANAYVLTYSVAPAAYYTGQAFGFITNFAVTGSATVNVNTLGAKTIKKLVSGTKTNLASGDIASGDFVQVVYDGTDMVWVNRGVAVSPSSATDTAAGIVELATTTETITGTDATRAATPDSIAALWESGGNVASASTVTFGEGKHFTITGTTTITAFAFTTDKAGREFVVNFSGALTLTHNATSLILPTGANITTAAGDVAVFRSEGSGNFRCISYTRANGAPNWRRATNDLGAVSTAVLSGSHGLGATPTFVIAYLECTSADAGYSVGDRVAANQMVTSSGGQSVGTAYNSTTVYFVRSSGLNIPNKGTGANVVATLASWKAVVDSYLFT